MIMAVLRFAVCTLSLISDTATTEEGILEKFMRNEYIEIPSGAKSIIVDVGAFNKTEFWERLLLGDVLVLGFEPMPSKFAQHPRHPNLILLPAAVGTVPGVRSIYIPEYEECATMLPGIPDAAVFSDQHQDFIRECSGGARVELQVPVVRLEDALQKLPEGIPIDLLKVDAQGMDLDVVLSAGRFLNSSVIKRLKLEVWNVAPKDRELLPYPEAPVKPEITAVLQSYGFSIERCWMQGMLQAADGRAAPEEDCFFVNDRLAESIGVQSWGNCFEDRDAVFEVHHLMSSIQYGEHPRENFRTLAEYDQLYTLDVVAKHCCGNPEIAAMQQLCWGAGVLGAIHWHKCMLLSSSEASLLEVTRNMPYSKPFSWTDRNGNTYHYFENPMWMASVFILMQELCERLAFFGLHPNLQFFLKDFLQYDDAQADSYISIFNVLLYVSPLLGGILADTLTGVYYAILGFSVLYMLGLVLLTLASIPSISEPWMIHLSLMVLIAVGAGGIKSCVNVMGAQQMHPSEHKKLITRFFTYFYATICLGAIVGGTVTPILLQQVGWTASFAFPLAFFVVATGVFVIGDLMNRYVKVKPQGSAVLQVIKVAIFSLARCSLEKNKESNGGRFKDAYIEDTRIFFYLLPLFALIVPFNMAHNNMSTTFLTQASKMDRRTFGWTIPPAMIHN
ncbi:hypothetical protein FOZ62_024853, partial [Perkinsus olseni]